MTHLLKRLLGFKPNVLVSVPPSPFLNFFFDVEEGHFDIPFINEICPKKQSLVLFVVFCMKMGILNFITKLVKSLNCDFIFCVNCFNSAN